MKKDSKNTHETKAINYEPLLSPVIYPTLEDIRIACRTIVNGVQDLTPMLNSAETKQLIGLASKWMFGLREHKKGVIDGMIDELSS